MKHARDHEKAVSSYIMKDMNAEIEKVYAEIRRILDRKGTCTVSVDGRCGSGKSTFAQKLKEDFDAEVFHMDDFFLRPEQRTPQRYASPGENVDHERFEEEILIPLSQGKAFVYYPFDCERMCVSETGIKAQKKPVTVIEGSYSQRSDLRKYYDLNVFLTVDPDEQIRRIIARNPSKEQAFREKWIPLEEAYFKAFDVEDNADIIVRNQ